jgi:hypothetical protein
VPTTIRSPKSLDPIRDGDVARPSGANMVTEDEESGGLVVDAWSSGPLRPPTMGSLFLKIWSRKYNNTTCGKRWWEGDETSAAPAPTHAAILSEMSTIAIARVASRASRTQIRDVWRRKKGRTSALSPSLSSTRPSRGFTCSISWRGGRLSWAVSRSHYCSRNCGTVQPAHRQLTCHKDKRRP